MSMRRILGRTGLVLVALAAVALVSLAFLNFTTGKKLEQFLAEAKAKGLPVSFADLGPGCPGSANAMPAWRAADALFDGEFRGTTNLSEEMAARFDGRPVAEKTRSLIAAAIEKNRRSIDFLLEASERPCYRLTGRRDVTTVIGNLNSMLSLVRLLGFDAFFRAEAGDVRGGLDEWSKGLRFVRLTFQEPNFMTALVAIANARSLLVVLNRIIDGRAVEAAGLEAILKDLDIEAWRAAVAGSTKGERAFWVETETAVLRGRSEALEDGWPSRLLLFWARPWVRKALMRRYAEFDDIERMLGIPYFQSRASLNAFDDRLARQRWYERLIDGGSSGLSATGMKEASIEALMETARIGLAARLYRDKEKHFPAAIADLVPAFLPREPMDPFTGKPFVYHLDSKGLLVYSLGSNEKDDGGQGTFSITQLVQKSRDDWAWRDTIR
ncbi:MAG: hypothetical protein NTZ26_06615 [Candidatus Aminicenantes bacterium]|nr:hypothetical protein [Candidatus Aminicenantes bacterium]